MVVQIIFLLKKISKRGQDKSKRVLVSEALEEIQIHLRWKVRWELSICLKLLLNL